MCIGLTHPYRQSGQGEHGREGLGAEAHLLPGALHWCLSIYRPGLGSEDGRRALFLLTLTEVRTRNLYLLLLNQHSLH